MNRQSANAAFASFKDIVHDHQFSMPALDRAVSLRRQVTAQAMQVFSGWGYREIQIPLIEQFDSIKSGLDEDQVSRSFRFVDRDGNLMVLRPDITPAIAKTYAYQLRGSALPLRVSYSNKVVRIERGFASTQFESYQVGIELIGAEGLAADVEILLIVLELLDRLGLKRFQINLADHKVAMMLLSLTGAPTRLRNEVESAVLARDSDEVRSILNGLGTRKPIVEAIAVMASLEGGVGKIAEIEALLPNEIALLARLRYLHSIEQTMTELGFGTQVRVDLGEVDGPGYYTGVGFTVVAEGLGRRLARGGRYDELIGFFGQQTPAVGFSFSLESMVELLHPHSGYQGERRRSADTVRIDGDDPVAGFKSVLERRSQDLPTRVLSQAGKR